ncbi:MAG: hypothetical protein J5I41_06720 [Saprospiraceae bacterium]|nr:hypothetical protein [Saprospiraceae bacterium]
MKYLALLLITMISLATSCQKEDPKTPDNWHKDVFRCKINGEEWKAQCVSDPLFGCSAVDCQYYWKDTKGFEIAGINRSIQNETYQSMSFSKYTTIVGDNLIPLRKEAYKDWNKPSGCRFHDLDTTSMRRLTILEVDTVNFLIKGTFEFTAINNCQDTMRITDGFFHVNFRF